LSRPDLTVSIGTLGDASVLGRCLRSIFAEDAADLRCDVRVVSNGPDPREVDELLRRDFPQVSLIRRDGPLGYCRTHNLVLESCDTRHVLVLDDDTIVAQGTLPGMVRFMDRHSDVGLSGCKTFNPDGTFQPTFGLLPSLKSEFLTAVTPDAFWPRWLYRDLSAPRDVEWLNGSFMLARVEAVRRVGVLDPYYRTFVCEPDWCYRMRRAGWRVVFVPDHSIVHVGGEHSINRKREARNLEHLVRYHVNRFYFFRKHYGPAARLLLRPIMILGAVLRAARYLPVLLGPPERRATARARLRACAWVLRLSLSPRPHVMPPSLRAPG
jgi:GT2 family glycosyltransferase